MQERLQRELDTLEALGLDNPWGYRWAFTHEGGRHDLHIVFSVMIHGDEVGSLPALRQLIADLKTGSNTYGGKVTCVVGNPEAGLAGQRFLERDLNRVFLATEGDAHEVRRARELMPILDSADVYLDFHQTILATEQPFYIFPWHPSGWGWARALQAAKAWVTRSPEVQFSAGTCCADEYVRIRGRPGITVELSEKGFHPEAAARAHGAMASALRLGDLISDGRSTLEIEAGAQPELGFFHTVHRESFATPAHELAPGWTNFKRVEAGQRVSADGAPEMLAPMAGAVLFPKYPPPGKELPKEIYRIVAPLGDHPQTLWGHLAVPGSEA